ncbi:hypothetical protein N9P63_02035 [Polaribacter sp.]|nr:hypothetical protein [Polaribacter sp.]
MKKFTYLFILIPFFVFSQSKDYKKKYKSDEFRFLTETTKITNVKDIIAKYTSLGYEILRNDSGEIFYKSNNPSNFLALTKPIDNHPFFKSNVIGTIYKKIFFKGDDITEAKPICIITEISIIEWKYFSKSKSDNLYNSIIKYIRENINLNNTIVSTEMVFKNPLFYLYYDNVYPFVNEINYKNLNTTDDLLKNTFSYGRRTETVKYKDGTSRKRHILGFQHNGKWWKGLVNLTEASRLYASNKNETLKNLRDNIGEKNMKEINTYDLQKMVQFFLDDCIRNNIKVPSIKTLSATFEPQDEGVIALALGMNNDNQIIIRIDPKSWQKASPQKKWYALYHELGHDVLNLSHGEGGKMMFNFADIDYTWNSFYKDKEYMFKYVLNETDK